MNQRFRFNKAVNSKFIKFIGVGVLNTAFGYSVYAALLWLNLSFLVALCIATLVGIAFNYFSIGRIVFYNHGDCSAIYRFVAAYALISIVNVVALYILVLYFSIDPYLSQLICISINVLMGWVLMNLWVFKK